MCFFYELYAAIASVQPALQTFYHCGGPVVPMHTRGLSSTLKVVGFVVVVIGLGFLIATSVGGGGDGQPSDVNAAATFTFEHVDESTVKVKLVSGERFRSDNIHIQGNDITVSDSNGQFMGPGDSVLVTVPESNDWAIDVVYAGSGGTAELATHSP